MNGFKRIFSNTFYLAGTNGISTLVALIFAMISTRYFSTARFGQLVAVLTLTTFMENSLRGSVGLLLTQRVAQRNGHAGEYFLPALWVYFWAGILFVVLGSWAEWVITGSMLLVWAVVLSTLISITRLISDASLSILRGFEQMGQEFWTSLIERLLFLVLLIAVVESPLDRGSTAFLMVFAINVLTQTLQMGLLVVPLWHKLQPGWRINRNYLKDLLGSCWLLWICAGIVILSTRVDLFLLQLFSGDVELGVFAATFKILDIIRITPAILCMAIYPSLSRYASDHRENFAVVYTASLKAILLIAVPFTLFTFYLSGPFLIFLFSTKYVAAIPLMKWMSLSIFPTFHNILYGYGLFAKEQRRLLAYSFGGALLIHTLAGCILIKNYGAGGAAISYGIGEWSLVAIALLTSPLSFKPFTRRSYLRPMLCCFTTGFVLFLLYPISPLGALAGAVITFLTGLKVFRIFTPEEYARIKAIYAPAPGSV